MGARSSYDPGVFCWVDLATNDVDGAKAFYATLFGWEYEDRETGGPGYSLARGDGNLAGGLLGLPTGEGPPRWQSYVAVESADDAVAAAERAGGSVLAPAADAGPAGRSATLADPQGAAVSVWQAGMRLGAEMVNQPGFLCWNDLMTSDVASAVAFYGDVFGWNLTPVEGAPQDRHSIQVGETLNGGIAALPGGGSPMPPAWLACFCVEDVPASRSTAEAEGGRAVTDTMELPTGRFVVMLDPQGAAFGLIDGQMDP